MKHFEKLENFVKSNKNWEEILKPNMKSIYPVEGRNWVVLMYNLMDMPDDKEIFDIMCQCRGTVIDKTTGEIICAPFTKFWNYKDEGVAADIDWPSAWVSHKRDGWIFKAFKWHGNVYWMSNGRVITENEKGAPVDYVPGLPRLNNMSDVLMRALNNDMSSAFFSDGFLFSDCEWAKRMPEGSTAMFELESPWNRIHTDLVKDAKLWLIGFRMPSGDEITFTEAKERFNFPFETPKMYNFKSAKEMLDVLAGWNVKDNGEGVVVCDKYFNRVKVKIDDYIRVKFESRGEDFGDNRLFKYYCMNEVDDLCAADPKVKARVEEISRNVQLYKKWLEEKVEYVNTVIAAKYADKKEFFISVDNDFPEEASLFRQLYNKNAEKLFDAFIEKGKESRTLYRDTLHLMGMQMTDGTEE